MVCCKYKLFVSMWRTFIELINILLMLVVSPLFPLHVVLVLQAEELMRKIEKEEEQISYDDPDKKVFHLCIVNLVIG